MEHSSSLITDSICVADNGGCIGCLIVGGGNTVLHNFCKCVSRICLWCFGPSMIVDRHEILEWA